MTEKRDQRICIKFYLELGHSSVQTICMTNTALDEDSMSDAQIKTWYRHFKNGWESTESDPRSGKPSTN
ncbi:hypothetical protein J437_LFUL000402 [Ladona fulva]|uniref:Mos1 transposase HTH domain-containing protein n=1 Tax=Ladona fulva TaxID=123851 RepID=A0A8K0K309_LADFU|nr:hypothetical protein J437_LFUL000402 [Ladona fulva]